jgi:hypothetical protein
VSAINGKTVSRLVLPHHAGNQFTAVDLRHLQNLLIISGARPRQ